MTDQTGKHTDTNTDTGADTSPDTNTGTSIPRRPPRDHDLFETAEGIYQAITFLHPRDRVVALHKYAPVDPVDAGTSPPTSAFTWTRRDTGRRYKRVIPRYDVQQATRNIAANPHARPSTLYRGVDMIEVPHAAIRQYWYPEAHARSMLATNPADLDALEADCRAVLDALVTTGHLPASSVGVRGSLLWRGHHAQSDIDLVIYGARETRAFLAAIPTLKREVPGLHGIPPEKVRQVAGTLAAKTGLPLPECLTYTRCKRHYLTYKGRILSVAFAPSAVDLQAWPRYEALQFTTREAITLRARVTDARFGYFYPAIVGVTPLEVVTDANALPAGDITRIRRLYILEREIAGYAFPGDVIEATGLLQAVEAPGEHYYQVYLGSVELYGRERVRVLERREREERGG